MSVRIAAMGCMRLSTEAERDEESAIDTLHAALGAGITLLDTADAYCWDDAERGHNERLIARALATWSGDRARVTVATKGGMTRPDGRWEPDGRAKHLIAACEASRSALGVERLDLYQLHVPDPRVPLSTSVRALARLKRDRRIAGLGLSNVTVGQIEEARRIADVDSIQVELSLWHDEHFLSGVAAYCAAHRLRLLAHRPLGGRRSLARAAAHPVLRAIAVRHNATPHEIALAWLAGLSEVIVPIPGATRSATARSIARASAIRLNDDDCARLDQICPAARVLRGGLLPRQARLTGQGAEIVLIMGLPGAGKSTLAADFVAKGYLRLNRDQTGGSLRNLVPSIDAALAAGSSRIVLDNTYVSRKSRAPVIHAAAERGVPVRCVWLTTSIEEAQVNAAERVLNVYGQLLDESALAARGKDALGSFGPRVQFRYQRAFEPPEPSEGFARIDLVPFVRRHDPAAGNRAVIVWCDDVLVRNRSGERRPQDADEVIIVQARGATLRRYADQGYRLLGLSWQPEVAAGTRTVTGVAAMFARMNALLGVDVDVHYCPHAPGPPRCWCRKPLPGLGVALIKRHHLDPAACIYVADGPLDPGYARRLGFSYRVATEFFDE